MKGLTSRFIFITFIILFSVYLLIPTFIRYKMGKEIPKVTKEGDPWYYSVIPSDVLKLGLDLRGGLHLVLGLDFDEVHRDAIVKLKNQLQELANRNKLEGFSFETTRENTVVIKYPNTEAWKKFDKLIGVNFAQTIDFVSQTANEAVLKMSSLYFDHVQSQALDQAIETLRNRIDEFGIAEPIITKQGTDKILLQFPGVTETGRLKDIISRTAKLSFQIVRTGPEVTEGLPRPGDDKKPPTLDQLKQWVAEFEKEKNIKLDDPNRPISGYLREINSYLAPKLPKGTEVLFHRSVNVNTRANEYTPYLLDREPMVTGEDLADARQSYDPQTNLPEVNFELNPAGAEKFEQGTGVNVNNYMAIVLDNNVHSAPRIKQKIGGGRARIEMGGVGRSQQEIQNDAKDTALVLRSGALPARLLFLEERVIGPSLGAEAIRTGLLSFAGGVVMVFGFLFFYYKVSGLVACMALTLNTLLTFAILAAFEGTMTLPGLAGMTLSLGMSVDANVLIMEHMREELRLGKSINLTIAESYTRSFSAIFDGNLTTVIAGIVLLQFGYGPIRGFAVTLVIGVICSMFTAVYITRLVFDYFIVSKGRKTISV